MSFQFDISLKTDHQASRKNIFPLKLKKGIEVPVKSNNTYLSILASNITLSKMLYIWWVTFSLSLFLPNSLFLSLSLFHPPAELRSLIKEQHFSMLFIALLLHSKKVFYSDLHILGIIIFQNICWVYIGRLRNVGPRNKRGCFWHPPSKT